MPTARPCVSTTATWPAPARPTSRPIAISTALADAAQAPRVRSAPRGPALRGFARRRRSATTSSKSRSLGYLKSTQEWEPADGVPAAERHFLRKKRRAAFFESKHRAVKRSCRVSKRYAIVSIGTNSTRLLLADIGPSVRASSSLVRPARGIGEGLGERGRLGDEPMQRTLEAIAQYRAAVRGHYIRLFAVATSALRQRRERRGVRAARRSDLLGVPLRVLSGEEEAAASYRGALTAFEAQRGERIGVAGYGGGSTEYAVGDAPEPEQRRLMRDRRGAVDRSRAGTWRARRRRRGERWSSAGTRLAKALAAADGVCAGRAPRVRRRKRHDDCGDRAGAPNAGRPSRSRARDLQRTLDAAARQ